MPADVYCYAILRRRGDGYVCPQFATPNGKVAVIVFTNRAKAETFLAARMGDPGWGVAGLTVPALVKWLRVNLADGAEWICLDPDPAGNTHPMAKSEDILVRLEGRGPT